MTGITARLKRSVPQRTPEQVPAHAVLWIIAGTIGAPFFGWSQRHSRVSGNLCVSSMVSGDAAMGELRQAWQAAPFGQFYVNSVIVSVVGVGLSLACCVLAAYALACIPTRWNQLVFVVFLSTMIPQEASFCRTTGSFQTALDRQLSWSDRAQHRQRFWHLPRARAFSRPQSIY